MGAPQYLIGDQALGPDHPDWQTRLAHAHRQQDRPLCLCQTPPVPMYIARSDSLGYLIKRMPMTGARHHPTCDSYEMPAELSGRGLVDHKAIIEDAETGLTRLKLDFSLNKLQRNGAQRVSTDQSKAGVPVTATPPKLSLRALLHLLYEDAGLHRWSPRMTGKRNWFVVRKYLQEAACNKVAAKQPIAARLLIPEPFSVEHKAAIAERLGQFLKNLASTPSRQHMGLLVGEVKAFEPARFGQKMIVKHLPDWPVFFPDDVQRRIQRNFGRELTFFQEDETIHLLCICTFQRSPTGNLQADTLGFMTVDEQWLPFETAEERDLLQTLRNQGRYFSKCLRYNLAQDEILASVMLTDTGETATALYLAPFDSPDDFHHKLQTALANSSIPYEVSGQLSLESSNRTESV